VMGHLGLLPQSVHRVGGFLRQATTPHDADILLADALALEEAGVFAIVLEAIPSDVARTVTAAVSIATIGIGAGPECDGQVQVLTDMLGLDPDFLPRHARRLVDLAAAIREAATTYVADVAAQRFPTAEQSSTMDEAALQEALAGIEEAELS